MKNGADSFTAERIAELRKNVNLAFLKSRTFLPGICGTGSLQRSPCLSALTLTILNGCKAQARKAIRKR